MDLDGTLAEWHDLHENAFAIGAPVPAMVSRVKAWLAAGEDVRVFTSRVDGGDTAAADPAVSNSVLLLYQQTDKIVRMIQDWTEEHVGARLPVTCRKDYAMKELWDDRCVQVVPNTGEAVADRLAAVTVERDELLGRLDRMRSASRVYEGSGAEADRIMNAAVRQPPPTGAGNDITSLVIKDFQTRADFGEKKYGTWLKAHNGRDALMDAYQEALDLCVYLRQAIEERDNPKCTT